MKTIIALFLLMLMCFAADAQTYPLTDNVPKNSQQLNLLKTFHVPKGTSPGLNGGLNLGGALYYRTSDNYLYIYNGTTWDKYAKFADIPPVGITGSGTTGYLPKWTGASALGNSLNYETAGSLQIGSGLKITGTINTGVTGNGPELDLNGAGQSTLKGINRSGPGYTEFIYESTNHIFRSGSWGSASERMRVDANGNVGIGTASPTDKLHLFTSGSGSNTVFKIEQGNNYYTSFYQDWGNSVWYTNSNIYARVQGIFGKTWLFVEPNGVNVNINHDKNDMDFNVKGDTDDNLFYSDASTDRIGIGNASPGKKLDVTGNGRFQYDALAADTALIVAANTTAAASNAQVGLAVRLTGANANASQTTKALYVENGHTGTTPVNYGIHVKGSVTGGIPLLVEGRQGEAAIDIRPYDASNPYVPELRFTPTLGNVSKIYVNYGNLMIEGGYYPYGPGDDAQTVFGQSGIGNVFIKSYPYSVPASPSNWMMRIKTAEADAIGLVIDRGSSSQTADLMQFRRSNNTVLTKFDSTGKITNYGGTAITNGQLLIGSTTPNRFEAATLTAGQNISITNGAGSVTIATDITLAQGTYTPTLTNTTNITSSTAYTTHYFRVGDQITVWGQVEITPTATGAVELRMSLPVATSDFVNTYEAAGTASEGTADPTKISNMRILAVTSAGVVKFIYDDQLGGSKTFSFSFTYKYVTP